MQEHVLASDRRGVIEDVGRKVERHCPDTLLPFVGDAGVETVAIDDVEPTLENTYSGKYPVWTFEHMYTKGEPNEVTKAFLDYITGDEYGAQMEKLGYGVASKMTATEH